MKQHGYNGTSVKDIVDAAEVPKGSFYTYFESKENFATEAIAAVANESYEYSQQALAAVQGSAVERLIAYFKQGAECAKEHQFSTGCFIGNMCQEMADSNDAIRNQVQTAMQAQTQLVASILEEGKAQGSLCTTINSDDLAEFLMCAWQGALMKIKATKSDCALNAFLRTIPQLLRCPD